MPRVWEINNGKSYEFQGITFGIPSEEMHSPILAPEKQVQLDTMARYSELAGAENTEFRAPTGRCTKRWCKFEGHCIRLGQSGKRRRRGKSIISRAIIIINIMPAYIILIIRCKPISDLLAPPVDGGGE